MNVSWNVMYDLFRYFKRLESIEREKYQTAKGNVGIMKLDKNNFSSLSLFFFLSFSHKCLYVHVKRDFTRGFEM